MASKPGLEENWQGEALQGQETEASSRVQPTALQEEGSRFLPPEVAHGEGAPGIN